MLVEQMFPQARERLATIGAAASVADAAEVTSKLHADLVVVCNETGSMVGVITKTDIVSQIGRCGADGCSARVDTIMTREVFSCRANEWLQDVWTEIKERDLQRIPVLGGDSKPIGILYSRDALQGLLGEVEDEETLLRCMDESTIPTPKILPPCSWALSCSSTRSSATGRLATFP